MLTSTTGKVSFIQRATAPGRGRKTSRFHPHPAGIRWTASRSVRSTRAWFRSASNRALASSPTTRTTSSTLASTPTPRCRAPGSWSTRTERSTRATGSPVRWMAWASTRAASSTSERRTSDHTRCTLHRVRTVRCMVGGLAGTICGAARATCVQDCTDPTCGTIPRTSYNETSHNAATRAGLNDTRTFRIRSGSDLCDSIRLSELCICTGIPASSLATPCTASACSKQRMG